MDRDQRDQGARFCRQAEAVLEQGFNVAAVMAPEVAGGWGRTLVLVRCVRHELEHPGEIGRRASAMAAGVVSKMEQAVRARTGGAR